MNIIGHNYIAYKLLGKITPNTLLGSHIPDFVPFLSSSVFSFDEIHENHEKLLKFVQKKYPNTIDLPLSMLCHSVKYGADEYNREIDKWLLKGNEKLIDKLSKMISEASGITYETARGPRLHNYLWCGVDLYLMKTNPNDIVGKLTKALEKVGDGEAAKILSDFYKKDTKTVASNIKDHFSYIKPETFQTTKGLTEYWSKFLKPLKEGDNLDVKKGIKLLEYIYKTFENEWESVINRVEKQVRFKMKPYIG